MSRSGQVRVAEYLTSVPWSFTVRPHAYLYYPQVRGVIQAIDNKDRQLPETITFASSLLSWFDDYKGGLTSGQAAALTLAAVPAANATTITVGNLPSVSSSAVVFAAGDFLQPWHLPVQSHRRGFTWRRQYSQRNPAPSSNRHAVNWHISRCWLGLHFLYAGGTMSHVHT